MFHFHANAAHVRFLSKLNPLSFDIPSVALLLAMLSRCFTYHTISVHLRNTKQYALITFGVVRFYFDNEHAWFGTRFRNSSLNLYAGCRGMPRDGALRIWKNSGLIFSPRSLIAVLFHCAISLALCLVFFHCTISLARVSFGITCNTEVTLLHLSYSTFPSLQL